MPQRHSCESQSPLGQKTLPTLGQPPSGQIGSTAQAPADDPLVSGIPLPPHAAKVASSVAKVGMRLVNFIERLIISTSGPPHVGALVHRQELVGCRECAP